MSQELTSLCSRGSESTLSFSSMRAPTSLSFRHRARERKLRVRGLVRDPRRAGSPTAAFIIETQAQTESPAGNIPISMEITSLLPTPHHPLHIARSLPPYKKNGSNSYYSAWRHTARVDDKKSETVDHFSRTPLSLSPTEQRPNLLIDSIADVWLWFIPQKLTQWTNIA